MTEPLIDRDALLVEIAEEFVRDGGVWMTPDSVLDAVLAYLRSVLTPEALRTVELVRGRLPGEDAYDERIVILIGTDLYRRIFGEDK